MALSDMVIFNQFYKSAMLDRLEQKVQMFNEASRGAFRLTTQPFIGSFSEESFFNQLAGAQRRVDRTVTNAAVTPIDLSESKKMAVKIAGGFGPIRYEPSQLTWFQEPTGKAVALFSEAFADAVLKDMVNETIGALVAAFNNNASVRNDAGSNPITFNALNDGQALFGDASDNIVVHVMTGKVAHKIIGQNLNNTASLFVAGNVRVLEILGTLVVRTDAPALYVPGVPAQNSDPAIPAKDYVLGLVPDAVTITDAAADTIMETSVELGKARVEHLMQADYTWGLDIKGYSWSGTQSPSTADLRTGTNWPLVVADVKNSAGVLTVGQSS